MKKIIIEVENFFDKHNWLRVLLLITPFFNEVYPPVSLLPDYIVDYLKILAFIILILIMIRKKNKPSALFISLIIIEGWWVISTMLNYPLGETGVYQKLFMDNINAISMALIVECFIDDPVNLTKGLMLSFELALYPDLVVAFIKPLRDNQQLLGYYSVVILWLLPALCVLFMNIVLNKQYFRSIALLAAIIAITIRTWCATIVVALMAFFGIIILGTILLKTEKFKNFKLPLSVFVILAVLLNVFVLFAYSGGSFPLIDVIIEKVLRRSTSFTERDVIWKEAMRMISEKPWIGHGFRPEIKASNSTADSFIHAHNQILQRLNATGIIGLITFIVFHIILCIRVDRSKNTFLRLVMVGGVTGVCITYITEGYKKFFRFYLLFFLAYHVDEIIQNSYKNTDYLLK